MPWQEQSQMELRKRFVFEALSPGANISELCRKYGISRKTGYKWIERFRQDGSVGLEDRSRRPKTQALATSGEVVLRVLELRSEHPRWAGEKLRKLLVKELDEESVPSPRTIDRILERAGKTVKRTRRRRPAASVASVPLAADQPNDEWTVDFKGWWRTGDGARCEPLTVRDAATRFVLEIRVLPSTKGALVRDVFEELFTLFGLPRRIRSDNGSPFACTRTLAGLTSLSAWWVTLGITPVRGRPGCPQDNGAHERLHADIRLELQAHAAESLASQQQACDAWRHEFNEVRPHQALGLKTPSELYSPSERRFAHATIGGLPELCEVRNVSTGGCIGYMNKKIYVSRSLRGLQVGVEPKSDGTCSVWLSALPIGTFHPEHDSVVQPLPEESCPPERKQEVA